MRRPLSFQSRMISSLSVAPHDADGLIFAVAPGNGDSLLRTARHVGSIRRCDIRRIAMCPIPGNIISVGRMDVGCWLSTIDQGRATRWTVGVILHARPEVPEIVSAVMPKRSGEWPMGNGMRRSKRTMNRGSRPREGLVCGQHQRGCAERRDQSPVHSIRHGTYQFVG